MYNLIKDVKKLNPLVIHYTNNVTINDCANATLAVGASPLMSFSYEE
ncbi:hydroxyethylthiazole kinase, partial [Terrisporobacter mayombei]